MFRFDLEALKGEPTLRLQELNTNVNSIILEQIFLNFVFDAPLVAIINFSSP